jgi:hypothetical protein
MEQINKTTPNVRRLSWINPTLLKERIKTNSMKDPIRAVNAIDIKIAAQSGKKELKVYESIAPSIKNSPWAKLIIPVEL